MHTLKGGVRIISYADVFGVLRKVKRFDIKAIFRSEHLLDAGGADLLLELAIGILAGIPEVIAFQGVAAVAEGAVLHGHFSPGAAAEVLGKGTESKVVALKQRPVI